MIDSTFRNINRLFVFSFKNSEDDPAETAFVTCYMLLVETKDFNVVIDNKLFLDQPVKKTNEKCMRNLSKKQLCYYRKFIRLSIPSSLL